MKALFSAREPSQKSPGIPSGFTSNIPSDLAIAVTSGLNLVATPTVSSAGSGDVSRSQVHTDYFGFFARWVAGNVNADIDVAVSFLGFLQGCSRGSLTTEQGNPIAADGDFELFASEAGASPQGFAFPRSS